MHFSGLEIPIDLGPSVCCPQWRHWGGEPLQGVTPEGKICGQIYKELWRNKVGQVKKVRGDTLQGGDTRVKSMKVTVMSKKGRHFLKEKIGVTDTLSCRPGYHPP